MGSIVTSLTHHELPTLSSTLCNFLLLLSFTASVTCNLLSSTFSSPLQPLVRLGKPAGMDRGLLIAHKETWDQFIRQREGNPHRMMFNETDDVLVVFEGSYDSSSHDSPSRYTYRHYILLLLSNTLFLNLFFISCVALISLLMMLLWWC